MAQPDRKRISDALFGGLHCNIASSPLAQHIEFIRARMIAMHARIIMDQDIEDNPAASDALLEAIEALDEVDRCVARAGQAQ